MEADYKKLLCFHNQEMKQELAKAHSETVTVRRYWGEVMDDLDKEHQAEVSRLPAIIKRLEKENLEPARQRDTAKDKLKERTQQYYEVAAELEEERGKNKKLTAQIIEYTTKEYRNRKTGARVHAPFPEGYVNEVNYDGTVKALAFLLGNECGVSHGKIRRLLSELTNGEIEISDGMINGLCAEFSSKTVREKDEIIKKLMTSPVMNVDFTNASVNGKSAQVLVLASLSADAALYIGRLVNIMGGTVIETESERLMRVGANQGAARMIVELGQEDGLDDMAILKRLQEKIGLSEEEAEVYFKKYGKQLV